MFMCIKLRTADGCGFLLILSVIKGPFSMEFCSQECAVCPLSGVESICSWEVTYYVTGSGKRALMANMHNFQYGSIYASGS